MKHGIGIGKKCKSDRYFITDVIEKLTSKAYVVVGDAEIEEEKDGDAVRFIETQQEEDIINSVLI